MTHPNKLLLRGINYDTGTNYAPGYLSREVWHPDLIEQELTVIRDELHCNAITIFGSEIDRLVECASVAAAKGLQIWLQPRLIDSSPDEMLAHLAELAQAAEQLRQQHTHVTLNLGCELSVFMGGLIPGATLLQRVRWLRYLWWAWMLVPRFNNRLNAHLRQARAVARSVFSGQITYGSGIWENVNWHEFDIVGLNYYRESSNQATYRDDLRRFHSYNKPIVITEFGCCSFTGADKLGSSGDSIVDYTQATPALKGLYQRNEQVQADYITDLLNIYCEEGIYGAFVFEFTEPSHPYASDPRHDLDIASYGIVKVLSSDPHGADTILQWEPKQAFHALAQFYQHLLKAEPAGQQQN